MPRNLLGAMLRLSKRYYLKLSLSKFGEIDSARRNLARYRSTGLRLARKGSVGLGPSIGIDVLPLIRTLHWMYPS